MVGWAGKLAKQLAILPFISGLQGAASDFLPSIIFRARSFMRLGVLTFHLCWSLVRHIAVLQIKKKDIKDVV